MNDFAILLRAIGLTDREFAHEWDMDSTNVSKLRRGKSIPSYSLLNRMLLVAKKNLQDLAVDVKDVESKLGGGISSQVTQR